MSTTVRQLSQSWTLYYHLPDNKKWTLASYPIICANIDTIEKVVALNNNIHDDTIRYNMLFLMLNNITPMWEDKQNRNGGCFSYKVYNKEVPDVWRNIITKLCGGTLTKQYIYMKNITGITISPKKNFCIIKIWLINCDIQDTSIISDIENVSRVGNIFRKHNPEF
jgi:hypothetical protein